jgi:hypothetical protein
VRALLVVAALLVAGCWDFDFAFRNCLSDAGPCLPAESGAGGGGGGAGGGGAGGGGAGGGGAGGGGADAGPTATWQSAYTMIYPLPLLALHAASKDEVYFAAGEDNLVHYLNGNFTEGYLGGMVPNAIGYDSLGFVFVGASGNGAITRIDAGTVWMLGDTVGGPLTITANVDTCVWTAGSQTYVGDFHGNVLQGPSWAPLGGVPTSTHNINWGWGAADDDFWLSTLDSVPNGHLYHLAGAMGWQAPIDVPPLNAIWGSASDDVWGVGPDGTIVHVHGGTVEHPDAGRSTSWMGVWGSGPNDIFLAGYDGVVAHWDGARFTRTGVSSYSLMGIHGTGPLDVWTIDTDGGIYHYGP